MDINLKGEMDGVEAAEEIWNSHSIPVIFLTAYSDEKTLQRAKITETSVKKSFGVLNKPFKEEDLHSLIEKTLHGK
jgi:CheY-like chemotaxis protein